MKEINLEQLAIEMSEQADFELSVQEAKNFIKKALTQTTDIIKNSKGKIMLRYCDLLQAYIKPEPDLLQNELKDLNEVQESRDRIWLY